MGTWGPGNFQNDGALDYVADIMKQLTLRITDAFKGSRADPDELGETILIPSVAIMVVLCEHCHALPPQTDLILEWKNKYLRNWDSYIDQLKPDSDYKRDRRVVIEGTFEKLEALAARYS